MRRPEWSDWEIEFTTHAEERMEERGLSEIDVRVMLHRARPVRRQETRGRWVLRARRRNRAWGIVVQPKPAERKVQIVTIYQAH